MSTGSVEYVLKLRDEATAALASSAQAARDAAQAQAEAAQAAAELQAAQERAAREAEAIAAAQREAEQAAAAQAEALARVSPEVREAAEAYKLAKAAAQAEADALGITVGELAALRRAHEVGGESADEWADRMRAASRASADAADSADQAADRAGKLGEGAGKLAGALGLVSPALGEAAQTAADFADVAEVGAQSAGALGVSLGTVGAAGLALAGVLAPLAQAVAVWHREMAEADARAAFLAAHAYDLRDATRALEDAVLAAAVATGRLTEQQAALAGISDAANRATEDFRQAQEDERKEAEKSFFAAQDRLDRLERLPGFLATAIDWTMGYSSAQEEARWKLEQLDTIAAQHEETVQATADAEREAAEATAKRDAASAASVVTTKSAAEAERALAAAIQAARAELQLRASLEQQLQGIVTASMSAEERARQAYRERAEAINAAIDAGAQDALVLAAKSASLQQLTADLAAATAAQAELNTATIEAGAADTGMSTTAGAISGGPQEGVNAIANAGPWGELIAGIIELFANFEDTIASFADYHNQIMDAIRTFPEMLTNNLDSILSDSMIQAVPDFVASLAENLPALFQGLMSAIPEMAGALTQALLVALPEAIAQLILTLSDPNTWIDVIQALIKGIADAVAGIFNVFKGIDNSARAGAKSLGSGESGSAAGNWLSETFGNLTSGSEYVGSYATGTDYVARTGMALVHQGESIVPATGASSGRTAAMGGGGGGGDVHLHLSGFAIGTPDQLVRELGRHLGTAGRRLAWPAGA